MYRKITRFLEEWKDSRYRKPLILQGARKLGKTWSILEFGQSHYENVAYFNFKTHPEFCKAFEGNISPQYLIPLLECLSRQAIVTEKTLIFFDEIQFCEKALASLKHFCDEAPGVHVIAAGSLPDIALNRKRNSLPAGKVDMKTLCPMDLEEFMLSLGESDLAEQIRDSFQTDTPLHPVFHRQAMELYRQYLIVGGIPECVMHFGETKNYILVRHTQDTMLAGCFADMSRCSGKSEAEKERQIYENIPGQLSKENTRFQYSQIKKGGRACEYSAAIDRLCLSGMISQVFRVENVRNPLENCRDLDAFKIYLSDPGLLSAMKNASVEDILYSTEGMNGFFGGLSENCVQVQLTANGYQPCYWQSKRGAEVDFVIQREGSIIPIEVRSADNPKAKSLNVYMDTFKPPYAIKLSTKNFCFENGKKTVPLYAAFCI